MMQWIRLAFAVLCLVGAAQAMFIRQHDEARIAEKLMRHYRIRSLAPWELLEALEMSGYIRNFNGTWISDTEFHYTALDKSVHKYNVATNTDSILLPSDFLQNYAGSSSFTFSPDNKKVLVRYDTEEVFRHSIIARYDIYNIETGSSTKLHNGEKLQYCMWAPGKDRLSYVYENNVYVHFEGDAEQQVTFEGVSGVIYNGIPDWVYEEEVLSSGSAMWWSPDGEKLAVGEFNDTDVKTFTYFIYGKPGDLGSQYPNEINLKYPKPGSHNPVVRLRVFDFGYMQPRAGELNAPIEVNLTAPTDIISDDHILQSVTWADDFNLLVTWMNRRQNVASMQLCSTKGECAEVQRFEEPDGWVDISTPLCLKSGKNCLFTYWIGNWLQVWNLDLKERKNIWESRGDFTVLRIYGYDEENDKLYYQATLPDRSAESHLFSNDECLTCQLISPEGEHCTWSTSAFSKGFSYYAVSCQGPNPSYTRVMNTNGTAVKNWEINKIFREILSMKLHPRTLIMNVSLADGQMGMVKLLLPRNLDEKKKYPLIVNVYGGPNSVRVTSSFSVGFESYMVSNREVIYATIDGRGTGNKGKKLVFSVNNDLGDHEVEDQIFVTKYLEKTLPYIDSQCVGIWGWSYGGYMTARVIANDTKDVFQAGVAVAPVTSWIYYDTIYTERYMGLPTANDNLRNYISSSVLRDVSNFQHHDFLLVHGSADDNVHYQQSLMLAKQLQEKDILFEQMIYSDENHGIGSYLPHLYSTMDEFWVNALQLETDKLD